MVRIGRPEDRRGAPVGIVVLLVGVVGAVGWFVDRDVKPENVLPRAGGETPSQAPPVLPVTARGSEPGPPRPTAPRAPRPDPAKEDLGATPFAVSDDEMAAHLARERMRAYTPGVGGEEQMFEIQKAVALEQIKAGKQVYRWGVEHGKSRGACHYVYAQVMEALDSYPGGIITITDADLAQLFEQQDRIDRLGR